MELHIVWRRTVILTPQKKIYNLNHSFSFVQFLNLEWNVVATTFRRAIIHRWTRFIRRQRCFHLRRHRQSTRGRQGTLSTFLNQSINSFSNSSNFSISFFLFRQDFKLKLLEFPTMTFIKFILLFKLTP